jgi:uncharacterized membrane protein
VDWLPGVVCGLVSAGLLGRWRILGGRRLPVRFWLGLALQAPIWASAYYPFAESWVLAAWGLWLTLDGLAAGCGRPALLGDRPEYAVWALVVSIFGWAGVEYLNGYFPVWTLLGFSFNPLAREAAVGLLGAPVVPTVLVAASLVSPQTTDSPPNGASHWRIVGALLIATGWLLSKMTGATMSLPLAVLGASAVCSPRFFAQGTGRLLSLAAGAATWAAFDMLWSQLGPAERLFTGYSTPAQLPAALLVCAFSLSAAYGSAAEFLDKPRFDPFSRSE